MMMLHVLFQVVHPERAELLCGRANVGVYCSLSAAFRKVVYKHELTVRTRDDFMRERGRRALDGLLF